MGATPSTETGTLVILAQRAGTIHTRIVALQDSLFDQIKDSQQVLLKLLVIFIGLIGRGMDTSRRPSVQRGPFARHLAQEALSHLAQRGQRLFWSHRIESHACTASRLRRLRAAC